MPSDITEVTRLKARAESDARKAAEAEGAYKEIMRRLKAEYGVSSIEEVEIKLKSLEAEVKKAEGAFDKALEAFKKEYGDASVHFSS